MLKIAAVVPSAGSGKRLRSKVPKPFLEIDGKPILVHTLENLLQAHPFTEAIVAIDPRRIRQAQLLLTRYRLHDRIRLVLGGKTRSESVRNAVFSLEKRCDWILVHDAARPLVAKKDIERLIKTASKSDGAILASQATATVKKMDKKKYFITTTLDRSEIFLAQTPQIFKKELLVARYKSLKDKAFQVTDEAALFDGTKAQISIVEGSVSNVKITKKEDLDLFKFYLSKKSLR